MTSDELNIRQYKKMTETPIPKLILGLAAPTILSMLITASTTWPTPSLWARSPPARPARWAWSPA